MKKIFITVFLLSTATLFAQTGTTVKQVWSRQQDSLYHFSFEYPRDWQLKLPGTNTRFFVTSYPENDKDNFRENINCIARQLEGSGISLKNSEAEIKEGLKNNFSAFNLISSSYVKWNNTDALCIEYTCTQKNGDTEYNLHMYQQMAIVNGVFFTLTYTAENKSYSKYEAVIKRIIQSLKIKI